jgi:hypothetical protein
MVGAGAGTKIFDKVEPEPDPIFLTSWSRSRSRAAQKWSGSATLVPGPCSKNNENNSRNHRKRG